MNFGPTADIAYGDNADNDTYAFGSESATVGDCVAAQVSSYNGAGINSVAKSFPGKRKGYYRFSDRNALDDRQA